MATDVFHFEYNKLTDFGTHFLSIFIRFVFGCKININVIENFI